MSNPQRKCSVDDQMKRKRNYKLLVDPELKRDAPKKIYRFDGCVPGESPIPMPRDPRIQKTILGGAGKAWDIPVPRFKYDKSSVCDPPECQVFVNGLSPNITPNLLRGTFSQVGPVVFVKVHRHPTDNHVLGAASVGYKHKGDGRTAAESLNGFQLYGCTLAVQLDDLGEKARQFLRDHLEAKNKTRAGVSLTLLSLPSSEGGMLLDKMSDSGHSCGDASSRNATPLSDDPRERSNSLTSPVTPSSAGLPSSSSSSRIFLQQQQHASSLPLATRLPTATSAAAASVAAHHSHSSPSSVVATPPPYLPPLAHHLAPLPAQSPTTPTLVTLDSPNEFPAVAAVRNNRNLTATPTHTLTPPTHAFASPTPSQYSTPDSGVSLATRHDTKSTGYHQYHHQHSQQQQQQHQQQQQSPVFVSSLVALSVSVGQRAPQNTVGGNYREQPSCGPGTATGGGGGGGEGSSGTSRSGPVGVGAPSRSKSGSKPPGGPPLSQPPPPQSPTTTRVKSAVDCLVESAAASLGGSKLATTTKKKTTTTATTTATATKNTQPPSSLHVSVVSPISDISSVGSESPGIVVDNGTDCKRGGGGTEGERTAATTEENKFINTFLPSPTASSGYSLATFDPSVSLQALMALKRKVGGREISSTTAAASASTSSTSSTTTTGGGGGGERGGLLAGGSRMETEDISGDESPGMVVNDVDPSLSQQPLSSWEQPQVATVDTYGDMDMSDMECDSPIPDVHIEVAATTAGAAATSTATTMQPASSSSVTFSTVESPSPSVPSPAAAAPLIRYPMVVDSAYHHHPAGYPLPFLPPPMGTFPPSAVMTPPIGGLPLPPPGVPFLFPPPPLGHPPPPFLHPHPHHHHATMQQSMNPHTTSSSSEVRHNQGGKLDKNGGGGGRYSQEKQRQRRMDRLSRNLREEIMKQLRDVLLKDLQKLYISRVGIDLADKHWESHLKHSKKPSSEQRGSTAAATAAPAEQPYRRMLGKKEVKELQEGHLSLAGTKRDRFVNFRIPTVSRAGTARSGGGVITMRRTAKSRKESFRLSPLYSDFSSSDSDGEEEPKIKRGKDGREGKAVKVVEEASEAGEESKPLSKSKKEADQREWKDRRHLYDDVEDDSDVSTKETSVVPKRKYESEDTLEDDEEEEDEDEEEGPDEDYYISQPGEDELSSASDFSTIDEEEEEEEDEEPIVDVVDKVRGREVASSTSSVVSVGEEEEEERLPSPMSTLESRKRKRVVISTDSSEEIDLGVTDPAKPSQQQERRKSSLSSPLRPDYLKIAKSPTTTATAKPVTSPVAYHPLSPVFGLRSQAEQDRIVGSFLRTGPDREDVEMFRLAWGRLRAACHSLVGGLAWAHYPCAVADPPTASPAPTRRRRYQRPAPDHSHATGSARSEGYYKMDAFAKKDYVTTRVVDVVVNTSSSTTVKSQKQMAKKEGSGRVNRAKQRRLASDFASAEISSDLIKYGHLKARKKMVRFARSSIHGWGLFALESIPADEMVIEYVGEIIRSNTADEREHRYEAMGIGSSYLFRLDGESVIDATKRGGVARFINHCCDPNCYAKVIVIGNSKKIVIYSKRDIHANEEITYDYKFPIEDEKIPCLCGAPQCRGTLN